jgi:hypothetical protein
MLNRKLLPAMTTAALVAFGGFASQAFAADAPTSASVNIVAPLAISETFALDFGDVGPDADNATSVVLTSGGVISTPDGAGLFGAHARGEFAVTGETGQVYVVTDPGTVQLDGANGLDVTNFTFTANGCADVDAATCTATLAGGSDTLYVGATLAVPANHTAGGYTNTFTLTVNYQ